MSIGVRNIIVITKISTTTFKLLMNTKPRYEKIFVIDSLIFKTFNII